jgi:hypothetical protein
MKNILIVSLLLLGACSYDPVSPVAVAPEVLTSAHTVTCTNGQNAPAATIQKGNRSFVTVNFCVAKTVNGFEGPVTNSTLQTERFVFDDPNAVWSMSRAESISQCMTANQGNPLCYFPYI